MNGQYGQNNETNKDIELMDYVRVLLRHWLLIAGIVCVSVIGTFLFFSKQPKVYKVSAALEIGTLNKDGGVETLEQLKGKIESDVYGMPAREKFKVSERMYPKQTVEIPRNTRLVRITMASAKTDQALQILEELTQNILADHAKIFSLETERVQNEIKSNENAIALLWVSIEQIQRQKELNEKDVRETNAKIDVLREEGMRTQNKIIIAKEGQQAIQDKINVLEQQLVYQQTPGTQFALYSAQELLSAKKREIEDLYSRANNLEIEVHNIRINTNMLEQKREVMNEQMTKLQQRIEDVRSQNTKLRTTIAGMNLTKVVKKPAVSEEPIAPRPLLNTAIAGLLGVLFSVFFAFSKEWWQRSMRAAGSRERA